MLALIVILSNCLMAGCMQMSQSAKLSRFLRNLSADDYDTRIRPTVDATNVSIQIGVLAMGPLSLTTMSIRSDILLRMWWHDLRLAYDNSSELTLAGDVSDIIWIPDVYVFNAIETERHKAFKSNIRTIIGPNGNIYTSLRLTIDFSCEMDFKLYPMDTQYCSMKLESYSYLSSEVVLKWITWMEPVQIMRKIQLLGYEISVANSTNDQLVYGSTETFNILEARFRIKRIFLYHIFHIYIPSMLIVLLSWSTFWIPPSAVPARVTLVVTNFLTSMLVFSSAGKSIPEISYHTALELFVLFNSVLIFMAMLEYLVVLSKPNFLSKKPNHSFSHQIKDESRINKSFVFDEPTKSPDTSFLKTLKELLAVGGHFHDQHIPILDRHCRILFPLVYIVFVTIYFLYYLLFA